MGQGTNYNLITPFASSFTGGTITTPLQSPAGTVSAPGVAVGEATTGAYLVAASQLGIAVGGANGLTVTSSAVTAPAASKIGWSGSTQLISAGDGILQMTNHSGTSDADSTHRFVLGTADSNGAAIQWSGSGGYMAATTGNAGAYYEWHANELAAYRNISSAIRTDQGGARIGNTMQYSIASGSGLNTVEDVGFGRTSAGVAKITNGSTGYGKLEFASSVTVSAGAGTPEGSVTASVGAIYLRTDGGAGTALYVKESGTGNTGWIAK